MNKKINRVVVGKRFTLRNGPKNSFGTRLCLEDVLVFFSPLLLLSFHLYGGLLLLLFPLNSCFSRFSLKALLFSAIDIYI